MEPSEASVWPYVHCAACHHLFRTARDAASQPTLPFWLTDCGHLLCNNHIRPDKTCSACGAQDIQVASLSHQLNSPMADWFRPLPHLLDTAAQAANFQFHLITTLVEAYKSKCSKQRELINSLRAEVASLKQEHEMRETPNGNNKRTRYDNNDHFGFRSSDGAAVMTPQSIPASISRAPSTLPGSAPRNAATYEGGPPRPESRFGQFAFSPPEGPGASSRSAPMRVAQTPVPWNGPAGQPATPRRPLAGQLPGQMSRQQMPPPPPPGGGQAAAGRFRPAPTPAPQQDARVPFRLPTGNAMGARSATPAVNRMQPTNRQRFGGPANAGGYRPPGG